MNAPTGQEGAEFVGGVSEHDTPFESEETRGVEDVDTGETENTTTGEPLV